MSTFDQQKNKKSGSPEEFAKEFLPTNGQESRMSNAFALLKSQSMSQEEMAKEFLPTSDQANRMSNAFTSIFVPENSQPFIQSPPKFFTIQI